MNLNPSLNLSPSLSAVLMVRPGQTSTFVEEICSAMQIYGDAWELLSAQDEPRFVSRVDEINRVWREARGEWVLFLGEGKAPPSPKPFTIASDVDVICPQDLAISKGYLDLAPPFAIRRNLLHELRGFADLPEGLENFELGVRAVEAGLRILHAREWIRSDAVAVSPLTMDGVLALFFRHPYDWVLRWACRQMDGDLGDTENLLARFERLFGTPLPADCRYTAQELGEYFAELSTPPLMPADQVAKRLRHAVDAMGLYTTGLDGDWRFDSSHASNWVVSETGYFEARVGRTVVLNFPPPRILDGLVADSLQVDLKGRYEVEVAEAALVGLKHPTISLPLPVECYEQRDLRLFDFETPGLEPFMDAARTTITFPLNPIPGKSLRLGYSFQCRVSESLGGPGMEPPPSIAPIPVSARYATKLDAILKAIFVGEPLDADLRRRARRIYDWILDHIAFRRSERMGLFALDARAGNCGHQARLFALLCGRVGLAVREKAGIVAGDFAHEGILNHKQWLQTEQSDRGHPLFHVWSEVFLEDSGWCPVDFFCAGNGYRLMTLQNVRSASTRRYLRDWASGFEDYYFGHVDPYRIHLATTPQRLSAIPNGIRNSDADLDAIWRSIWGTRHSLRLSIYGLPPAALKET